jgi:hypothetical protein
MSDVQLLTYDQIEKCFQKNEGNETRANEIGLCPVTELIELCERKKKHDPAAMVSFKKFVGSIPDDGIKCDSLLAFVIPLDQERLVDALFERDEQFRVVELWKESSDNAVRCIHSVRRLLLRPTNQVWWDNSIYNQAENIYPSSVLENNNA